MSMFPHTMTLYNVIMKTDPGSYEDTPTYSITVLRGVLLDASKGANVRASGIESADAVTVYIPFNVEAYDGITGEKKEYIGPVEFGRLEDTSGYWTLSPNNSPSAHDFFVEGEIVEAGRGYQFISAKYDGVYNITKVDRKDFGSPDMQHWEVGAV